MISFCDIEKCHMNHYHKPNICQRSVIKSKERKVACDWDFTYVIVKNYGKWVFWQCTTRVMSSLILQSQFDILWKPTTVYNNTIAVKNEDRQNRFKIQNSNCGVTDNRVILKAKLSFHPYSKVWNSIDLSSIGLKALNIMLNIKLNLKPRQKDSIEGSISNICGLEAPSGICRNSPKHQNDVWLWQRSLSLLIT